MIVRHVHSVLFPIALLIFYAVVGCIAASVEIDAQGQQQQQHNDDESASSAGRPRPIQATFVNALPTTTANLYWAGNVGSISEGGLQLYYGPLEPGERKLIDAYIGQIFVLTDVPGYERLGEYVLGITPTTSPSTYSLTEESAGEFSSRFPPQSSESEKREEGALKCRSINNNIEKQESFLDKCQQCTKVNGCGFSLVRDKCFASHAVATANKQDECVWLHEMEESKDLSVDAWMNRATQLTLSGVDRGLGSKALKLAYRCLENAVERAQLMVQEANDKEDDSLIKTANLTMKKAKAALLELSAKLEAVFDDTDMKDMLETSRHPKLAEIHPHMPPVPRRTVVEAKEYIMRGEPVIITDMFGDGMSNPVAHKWTLEYLNQKVFGALTPDGVAPKFNVAADTNTRCCRYFEPQGKAKQAGYPYPFSPTTHLYRDTFSGFVKTVRKANRNSLSSTSTKPPLLHYLHEIVMNQDGVAVVAGGEAPQQLVDDLNAVTSQLRPLASKQPFFGDFAYAKVWLGMRGIVMPAHYDATDNLYVMAYGRKKAIIGEPGQLESLYRYPNGHPLVGSSQVNFTEPDMTKYPNFKDAKLREVLVGTGDVLYLPAWWWHQFEQPFEGTAALNLWSTDKDQAPDPQLRLSPVREHTLADQLEEAVTRLSLSGNEASLMFDALINGESSQYHTAIDQESQKQAKNAMIEAVYEWQNSASELPGGHSKTTKSPAELVEEHLDRTHKNVLQGIDLEGWRPGDAWDLSQASILPRELRDRCEAAPESSPFMSICG